MSSSTLAETVADRLFQLHSNADYIGEPVTILEHSCGRPIKSPRNAARSPRFKWPRSSTTSVTCWEWRRDIPSPWMGAALKIVNP
eukprot:scaffold212044_cov67-Cyclotella_meneghiniana.AAC.2